jgi:hypothetical protein
MTVAAAADESVELPLLKHGRCDRDGVAYADHLRCRTCGGLAGDAHPDRPLDKRLHCRECGDHA